MSDIKKLKVLIDGNWADSKSIKYMDIYNPSTGEIIAQTPCCTQEEVDMAIDAASRAFISWSNIPAPKRVQVLYKFRDLITTHLDELTYLVAQENGKVWDEAQGDVLKVIEITEFACGIPSLMMGDSIMNVTSGYDTVLYQEPVGVFAGIVPFNFPAMIPMGWMVPLCIATGNTIVLKVASMTPMTAMRCAELLQEAAS